MSGRECAKLKGRSAKILLTAMVLCLMTCACSGSQTPKQALLPPAALLGDIEIPDRSQIVTNGDMVRVILLDEEAMRLKNADLAAFRKYLEARND